MSVSWLVVVPPPAGWFPFDTDETMAGSATSIPGAILLAEAHIRGKFRVNALAVTRTVHHRGEERATLHLEFDIVRGPGDRELRDATIELTVHRTADQEATWS